MILYRPLGLHELKSIYQSQLRAFPRRLLGQPSLFLVRSEEAARQVAQGWASPNGSLASFVTRCSLADAYASAFEVPATAASATSWEVQVPVEKLIEFNGQIDGPIGVVCAFYGGRFVAYPAADRGLEGATAEDQFLALTATLLRSPVEALREMATHPMAVFLNFFYWESHDFSGRGMDLASRDAFLASLRALWADTEHSRVPLGVARA